MLVFKEDNDIDLLSDQIIVNYYEQLQQEKLQRQTYESLIADKKAKETCLDAQNVSIRQYLESFSIDHRQTFPQTEHQCTTEIIDRQQNTQHEIALFMTDMVKQTKFIIRVWDYFQTMIGKQTKIRQGLSKFNHKKTVSKLNDVNRYIREINEKFDLNAISNDPESYDMMERRQLKLEHIISVFRDEFSSQKVSLLEIRDENMSIA